MSSILFNLLVNSIFSLAGGLFIIGLSLWLFRVETGTWKLTLLSIPFIKMIYDCMRGLPANSVLLRHVNPFRLPPKHQILTIGGTMTYLGPRFNLMFSVNGPHSQTYASSIGDYLVIWLKQRFGPDVPLAIVIALVGIATLLVAIRAYELIRFERSRRVEHPCGHTLYTERVGLRRVEIYVTKTAISSPFTGGIIRPYICIPESVYLVLDQDELQAVISHEIAHIRRFDWPVTLAIQLLGDVFWFVPGYRALSKKIDSLREIVADQWATQTGSNPIYLASSLVKIKSLPFHSETLYSAFSRKQSLIESRIHRLLGTAAEKKPRFGWNNKWLRAGLAVWIATATMIVTFGGNQATDHLPSPIWLDHLIRGLMR